MHKHNELLKRSAQIDLIIKRHQLLSRTKKFYYVIRQFHFCRDVASGQFIWLKENLKLAESLESKTLGNILSHHDQKASWTC